MKLNPKNPVHRALFFSGAAGLPVYGISKMVDEKNAARNAAMAAVLGGFAAYHAPELKKLYDRAKQINLDLPIDYFKEALGV